MVLEDRLPLFKVHGHEAIAVIEGHLSCEGLHRPVLDQVLYLWRKILKGLHVFDILGLHGRQHARVIPFLQSVKLVKHTRVRHSRPAPQVAVTAAIVRRVCSLHQDGPALATVGLSWQDDELASILACS